MRNHATVLSVLALIAGCGGAYDASSATPQPQATKGGVADRKSAETLGSFLIDDGAGVTLPVDNFAITENGGAWRLAWRGDDVTHEFSGQIVNAGTLSGVVFTNGFDGDQVVQTAANRVTFDAITDGLTTQYIDLVSDSEPVRFSLQIDGADAVFAVVFSSGGLLSTSDSMPFDLSTSLAAAPSARTAPAAKKAGTEVQAAGKAGPSFVSAPRRPGDGGAATR